MGSAQIRLMVYYTWKQGAVSLYRYLVKIINKKKFILMSNSLPVAEFQGDSQLFCIVLKPEENRVTMHADK